MNDENDKKWIFFLWHLNQSPIKKIWKHEEKNYIFLLLSEWIEAQYLFTAVIYMKTGLISTKLW